MILRTAFTVAAWIALIGPTGVAASAGDLDPDCLQGVSVELAPQSERPATRPFSVERLEADLKKFETDPGSGNATAPLPMLTSFEETLAWVASQMPAEPPQLREDLIRSARALLERNLKIREAEISDPRAARIRYPIRFLHPLAVERSQNATIEWPREAPQSLDEAMARAERAIDLLAEARFAPSRWATVYRRGHKRYVNQNIQVIADAVAQKITLFAGEPEHFPAGSPKARALQVASSFLLSQLPIHFAALRAGLKVDSQVIEIFNREGPQGIYRYLYRRHGPGLAMRYWWTHVKNARAAISLAGLAVIGPQAIRAYLAFYKRQQLKIDDPDETKRAEEALKENDRSPAEVVEDIRNKMKQATPEEQAEMQKLLDDLEDQGKSKPGEADPGLHRQAPAQER